MRRAHPGGDRSFVDREVVVSTCAITRRSPASECRPASPTQPLDTACPLHVPKESRNGIPFDLVVRLPGAFVTAEELQHCSGSRARLLVP